jgi:hypothetical protein
MLSVTRMNGFGLPCDRALRLDTAPGAILRARLYAPCDPVVRVEIRHAGLRFALETGEDGQIDVTLPAMMADAVVEAAFADGTVVRAGAAVPEVAGVDRIAIVSDGWAGLSLDANEAAVRYGGANGFLAVSGQTRDGAVHRLGESGIEAPVVAEVYTLPAGRLGMLGSVSFQIEVPVTSSNCARDIAAEVVRSQGGGQPVRGELRISVPSCEAEGDVLVVGLPAPDLRLARN